MKNVVVSFILIVLTISTCAQSLVGAWETTFTTSEGVEMKNVVIFSEKYMTSSWFNATDGAFISVKGGSWKLNGKLLEGDIEFDSRDSVKVGGQMLFNLDFSDSELRVEGVDILWKRIDTGAPGELKGAWLISGRKREGVMQNINTDRPRKTMKILSGTRFQWIAYNTETKEFMGTGGGHYTTIDGKYTENIEFFSRDNTRVGAKLEFDYKVQDGDWYHSGFSSKGDPLYEVWNIREN